MSWRDRHQPVEIGDTVRFTRRALRSIFTAEPVGVSPEGVVTGIEERDGMRFATVAWSDPGIPDLVNVLNLARAHRREAGR